MVCASDGCDTFRAADIWSTFAKNEKNRKKRERVFCQKKAYVSFAAQKVKAQVHHITKNNK